MNRIIALSLLLILSVGCEKSRNKKNIQGEWTRYSLETYYPDGDSTSISTEVSSVSINKEEFKFGNPATVYPYEWVDATSFNLIHPNGNIPIEYRVITLNENDFVYETSGQLNGINIIVTSKLNR